MKSLRLESFLFVTTFFTLIDFVLYSQTKLPSHLRRVSPLEKVFEK